MGEDITNWLKLGVERKAVWDRNTIKNYVGMSEGRDISHDQVKSIRKMLESGILTLYHIVVMAISDAKYLIIDGQHRFIASKEYLEAHPESKIAIHLTAFPKTGDKILLKEMWSYFTKQKAQRAKDLFKMYADTIPVLKRLLSQKEVAFAYNSCKTAINLKVLFSAWFDRKSPPHCQSGSYANVQYLKERLYGMDVSEADEIIQACTDIQEVLGTPTADNPFYSALVLKTLIAIWAQNKDTIGRSEIKTMWKNKLRPRAHIIGDWGQRCTLADRKEIARKLLDICNSGRSKNIVVLK